MKMYKCVECGNLFEAGEQASWQEDRGEYWGAPCSETNYGCPICQGDYEEAVKCEICGAYHIEDELIDGVCENCISKNSENIELIYKISEEEKKEIQLNSFLMSVFEPKEIEEILIERLKFSQKISHKLNFETFINEDKKWFASKLKEVFENEK